MKRTPKRLEVAELLPAMLLSALIMASTHSAGSRASGSSDEPSVQITVTTVR